MNQKQQWLVECKAGFRHPLHHYHFSFLKKKLLIAPHTSWATLAHCNPLLSPSLVENYQTKLLVFSPHNLFSLSSCAESRHSSPATEKTVCMFPPSGCKNKAVSERLSKVCSQQIPPSSFVTLDPCPNANLSHYPLPPGAPLLMTHPLAIWSPHDKETLLALLNPQ